MSARTNKPTDLPVRVGVNLNLKSRPLPVVITAVIVAATLALLPGIGGVRARAVVEYREANGAFTSIEDIQNVYGIGPGLFERIKERIRV